MEYFYKHKILILRTTGALMILIGLVVHFWVTPKEGVSANQRAAANVARMEAKLAGSGSSKVPQKKDNANYTKELIEAQEKQMQYLTIMAILLGIGSLGYSFIPRKEGT